MKLKIVLFFLLCCAVAGYADEESTEAFGMGMYALAGYNAATLNYSEFSAAPAAVNASGLLCDFGFSFRFLPMTLFMIDVAGGTVFYTAGKTALESLNPWYTTPFYSTDYDGEDIMGVYGAADLYLIVPVVPLNLFVGYKYNWISHPIAAYILGTHILRAGVDVLITSTYYLKAVFEMPFGMAPTFQTGYNSGSITGVKSYTFMAAFVWKPF
jgi:hypothetical protein